MVYEIFSFLFQELFDEHRWEKLVDQFRQENFALHQLHKQSMLEITLQCGLASLKTPYPFTRYIRCHIVEGVHFFKFDYYIPGNSSKKLSYVITLRN